MQQTRIYLVRHGQTQWNMDKRMQGQKDSPLTEKGMRQAKNLHNRLLGENIGSIYSSTSERARETAEIIKGDRNVSIIFKSELKEINMGTWEGMKQCDVLNSFPHEWDCFSHSPLTYSPVGSGETYQDLADRVIPAIKNILASSTESSILIVSHRITLKVIMAYFGKQKLEDLWTTPDIDPASLSVVCVQNGIGQIITYADTVHLSD